MLNSRDDVRNSIVTLIDKEVSDVDPDFKDELQIGDIYYGNILENNLNNNAEKAITKLMLLRIFQNLTILLQNIKAFLAQVKLL